MGGHATIPAVKNDRLPPKEKKPVTSSPPGPAPPQRSGESDTTGPEAVLRALQRTCGNAAVQRLVAKRPGAGNPPGGPEADGEAVQRVGPAVPSVAGKHTVTFFKEEVPVKVPLAPVPAEITGVEGSASGTFEGEPVNEGDAGAPAAKVGVLGGVEKGVQFELEQAWEKSFVEAVNGMKPKVTEGGKFTSTGGEFGIEGALEGENVTFKLGFTFVEVDKGGVKFLTLKPGAEFPSEHHVDLPKLGIKGKLELKSAITINIQPDKAQIGRWLAETFGPELAAFAVPVAAGVVCIAFIGGTMYLVDDAHKRGLAAGKAAAAAGQHAANFSASFADVSTGGQGLPGAGGDEGATAAEETIKKQVGIRESIVERNRQKGQEAIAREAYAAIAQQIYDRAKVQYREAHKGDFLAGVGSFFGVEDVGTGLGRHMMYMAIVLENKQPGGPPLNLTD